MVFTVADYILKRLSEQRADTLFGVPAAYCAPLFEAAAGHGIKLVVTASDLEAGYAADGYARTKGIGAVSVAYGVGTLSMINAIAGADVERSPVVVINGGPTSANLTNLHRFDVVFSHSIGQDATTIVGLIRSAQSPLILVGVEIQRYGLADKVANLLARLGVHWATALLGKSTLAEQGVGWIGVYDPPHSLTSVKNAVEQADLLVTLGCVFPNGYAALVQNAFGHMVQIYDGKVRIKTGAKQNAEIAALVSALVTEAAKAPPKPVPDGASPAIPGPASGPLTYKQVFERIGAALDNSWITIPDTFLGVYSAANLPVKGRDAFLCSSVWASIGHSVAAAIGASFGSSRRPLVICGDGGFHMMAQALSTMVHYGRNPAIVIIANGIYGFEQFLVDPAFFDNAANPPRPYVVLNQWDFVKFADGLGLQFAQVVSTAAAFDAALAAAKTTNGPALIVAEVNPHDLPAELP